MVPLTHHDPPSASSAARRPPTTSGISSPTERMAVASHDRGSPSEDPTQSIESAIFPSDAEMNADQAFLTELLKQRGTTALYHDWADVTCPQLPTVSHALIACDPYHLFVIAQQRVRLKSHLLDIQAVHSPSPDAPIRLVSSASAAPYSSPHRSHSTDASIDSNSNHHHTHDIHRTDEDTFQLLLDMHTDTEGLLRALVTMWTTSFPNLSLDACPISFLVQPPSRLSHSEDLFASHHHTSPSPSPLLAGFVACHWQRSQRAPRSPALLKHLQSVTTRVTLSQCPEATPLDTTVLLQTLSYNSCTRITHLSLSATPLHTEALHAFLTLLCTNTTLLHIDAAQIGLSAPVMRAWHAAYTQRDTRPISNPPSCRLPPHLLTLDASRNTLDAAVLCDLFSGTHPHTVPLRALHLRDCQWTPSTAARLCQTLARHPVYHAGLCHLSLSHNTLGSEGSAALAVLLRDTQRTLETLDVSHTDIHVDLLADGLVSRDGATSTVATLLLAGGRLTHTETLVRYLRATTALRHLDLSHGRMPSLAPLLEVLKTVAFQSRTARLHVALRGVRELNADTAGMVAAVLASETMVSLDLSQPTVAMAGAMDLLLTDLTAKRDHLQQLVLHDVFPLDEEEEEKEGEKEAVAALCELLRACRALQSLAMRGSEGHRLGRQLSAVLYALMESVSPLEMLDIRHHHHGEGAVLAHLLDRCATLRVLEMDGNAWTMDGLMAMREAILVHPSLVHVDVPLLDCVPLLKYTEGPWVVKQLQQAIEKRITAQHQQGEKEKEEEEKKGKKEDDLVRTVDTPLCLVEMLAGLDVQRECEEALRERLTLLYQRLCATKASLATVLLLSSTEASLTPSEEQAFTALVQQLLHPLMPEKPVTDDALRQQLLFGYTLYRQVSTASESVEACRVHADVTGRFLWLSGRSTTQRLVVRDLSRIALRDAMDATTSHPSHPSIVIEMMDGRSWVLQCREGASIAQRWILALDRLMAGSLMIVSDDPPMEMDSVVVHGPLSAQAREELAQVGLVARNMERWEEEENVAMATDATSASDRLVSTVLDQTLSELGNLENDDDEDDTESLLPTAGEPTPTPLLLMMQRSRSMQSLNEQQQETPIHPMRSLTMMMTSATTPTPAMVQRIRRQQRAREPRSLDRVLSDADLLSMHHEEEEQEEEGEMKEEMKEEKEDGWQERTLVEQTVSTEANSIPSSSSSSSSSSVLSKRHQSQMSLLRHALFHTTTETAKETTVIAVDDALQEQDSRMTTSTLTSSPTPYLTQMTLSRPRRAVQQRPSLGHAVHSSELVMPTASSLHVTKDDALLSASRPTTLSTYRRNVDVEMENRLFLIKGRHSIRVIQVRCHASSLSVDDAFLLDLPQDLMLLVYVGPQANRIERGKAAKFATRYKHAVRKGLARIIYLDDDDDDAAVNARERFAAVLGAPSGELLTATDARLASLNDTVFEKMLRESFILARADEAEERPPQTLIMTQINGHDALTTEENIASEHLLDVIRRGRAADITQAMLVTGEVYLLDCGTELYVWEGRQSPRWKRTAVLALAQQRLVGRPAWTLLLRTWEHEEHLLFTEKFADWPERGVAAVQRAAAQRAASFDVAQLYASSEKRRVGWQRDDSALLWEPSSEIAATQQYRLYLVDQYRLMDITERRPSGVFSASESYVLVCGWERDKKHRCALFYWQGRACDGNTKGAAALLCHRAWEQSVHVGGFHATPTFTRVVQMKEPVAFRQWLQGCYVITDHSSSSSHDNDDDKHAETSDAQRKQHSRGGEVVDETNEKYWRSMYQTLREKPAKSFGATWPSAARSLALFPETLTAISVMYHIKPSLVVWELCAMAVVCHAVSLNSRDAFVVLHRSDAVDHCYLWMGRGVMSAERPLLLTLASQMSAAAVELMVEGEESADFWEALGGQSDYANADYLVALQGRKPRLFECHLATGEFMAEEVAQFCQDDLSMEYCYVLDAYHDAYVWRGASAPDGLYQQTLQLALTYAQGHPDGVKRNVYAFAAGEELLTFTCHFHGWQGLPQLQPRRASLSKISEDAMLLQQQQRMSLSYVDLCKRPLPRGVNALVLEQYLSEEEFREVFGMERSAFMALPEWMRDNKKKELGLY